MKYGFGVDVGGTAVKLGLFDENGALAEKWTIPTRVDDTGSQILPDIAAEIAGCMDRKGLSKEDILGIGIGVPGPVNDQGLVNRCVNLNWGVFNIHDALSELTGLPVKAGNDANVAALGEYYSGGGKGCHSMVLVTLGTGVGGGIIIGGKILGGAHGVGGEIATSLSTRTKRNTAPAASGAAQNSTAAPPASSAPPRKCWPRDPM